MTTRLTRLMVAAVALLLIGTLDPRPASRTAPAASGLAAGVRDAAGPPQLPRETVEVGPLKVTGRTITVPAGGDLQAALHEAQGGERIALEPGATYRGSFRLPRKSGNGWIVITSGAPDLPPPGQHVTPAHAALMPRLVSSSGPVFSADPGAHHYRLVGLEIAPGSGDAVQTLVELGDEERSLNQLPHHIVVDRCYIHGDAARGGRRGIAMNSRHTAIVDSYLADFKEGGADTQAIGSWNGAGPFRIEGNYLEASGENVMFGGADPSVANLVPSDIDIRRNHFAKPLRWKAGHPTFEGTEWTVKNLLELKNARRVRIDGNLFEYNWPQAQNGFAILFTVRNQDGDAPWSTVEDVVFSNNLVRHVAGGINILGRDDNYPSQQARRIAIRNNVFLDVGGEWGNGRLFQMLDGAAGVTIDHNTALQSGSILAGGDDAPHTNFVFQNNIVYHNEHGITGSDTDVGNPALQRYFPGAVVRRNVIVGGDAARYPPDNFFPSRLDEVGRVSLRQAQFRLTMARAYAGAATDGRDPGADIAAVERALGGLATVGLVEEAHSNSELPKGQRPSSDRTGATTAELGLLASLLLLIYVYAGYPLVAALRAAIRPRPPRVAPIEPSVSILVVAYNEAERISARIENLLALDYPRERLEIVIASDGSTDTTVGRAREYEGAGVSVRAFDRRRGKSAVINEVVPHLRGEVIVFADARQRFEAASLRALVGNFADPGVGAVSGELVLAAARDTAAAARGTAFYWRYEKFIRSAEGRSDSTVGATGAIYAIRGELFEPIPDDTILDDVLIPIRIVRRGYRVAFEPAARAYDTASATGQQEFIRKARTIAGTFQLLAREQWLLNPRANRLWFETVSHKALRLTLPLLHASLFAANVAVADRGWYGATLAAQVVFYAAAAVGYMQRHAPRRSFLFSVPCAICLLCWATVIGFLRFVTNRQRTTWECGPAPTAFDAAPRPAAAAPADLPTPQPEARSAV